MNESQRERAATLQHRQLQQAAAVKLSSVSRSLGEPAHGIVDSAESLRLATDLNATLKRLRSEGKLRRDRFRTLSDALRLLVEQIHRLGSDTVFCLYFGPVETGFFAGQVSGQFVQRCLEVGCDDFVVAEPSLRAGVVLDVVVDDLVMGNFYEVEWW